MGKQYDTEVKMKAVRLATELNKSVAQVAQESGVPSSTLHGWVKATQEQPDPPSSVVVLALTDFVITWTNLRVIRYPADSGSM